MNSSLCEPEEMDMTAAGSPMPSALIVEEAGEPALVWEGGRVLVMAI